MKSRNYFVITLVIAVLVVVTAVLINGFLVNKGDSNPQMSQYNPQINAADFVSTINNTYFTLTPKTKYTYLKKTGDGTERVEVYVTEQKKNVMGVDTVVVWDRAYSNNQLIENTYDYYAQDKSGNVWYFGEKTQELENGKVTSTSGTWEAGVDGAQPGIIMKANPQVGDNYRQEYYMGQAEDMAKIIAFNQSVTVPFGTFINCLNTYDYSPLEPDLKENKYYSPLIKGVVLDVDLTNGEKEELVSIQNNTQPSP